MISVADVNDVKKPMSWEGDKINLRDYPTGHMGNTLTKSQSTALLEAGIKQLADVQEKFHAQNQYCTWIIPFSVKVNHFKAPTPQALDFHYLWRHIITWLAIASVIYNPFNALKIEYPAMTDGKVKLPKARKQL